MQKHLIAFFIAGAMLCSCAKQEIQTEILVESFPIEETLTGTRIDLEDGEYLSNCAYFADDYLIFRAIRDKYFLQVYDKDFNLVGKLLNKGEGPNELPDAMWYGQWSGNGNDPKLLVFSEHKNRFVSLNINPFEGLTTVCDLPASESLSPTMIYQTSDTTYIGITLDMFTGADLFSYNTDTKVVNKAPRLLEFIDGYESFYTSQQVMDYNRKNLNICCGYQNFPTLVIYDKDFKVVREVNVGMKVNTETLRQKDEYTGFCKVAYYKDYIITMMIEMLRNEETADAKVLVFDRDGEPKASYDVGQAMGLIIDEAGRRLLTYKYDEELDVAYLDAYAMPDWLN